MSHWWYTDPRGAIFQKLGKAIAHVWGACVFTVNGFIFVQTRLLVNNSRRYYYSLVGQQPALIREGGSYGGITRFLEEKLAAPAIHFPMGQVRHVPTASRFYCIYKCPLAGMAV